MILVRLRQVKHTNGEEGKKNIYKAIAVNNQGGAHVYFSVVHLSANASVCISASLGRASVHPGTGTGLKHQFNTGQTHFL